MADQIHQVGGILAVMDGEGRLQSDPGRVFAQQPRADGMEGAGPGQHARERTRETSAQRSARQPVRAEGLLADALHPPCHLDGGAPRKRHQKDAAGIDAAGDQMHHAVGEGAGLARSRPRDHQEGRRGVGHRCTDAVLADAVLANTVLDRAALVGVELVEIGRHWRGRIALLEAKQSEPCSVFVRNSGGTMRLVGWVERSKTHRGLGSAASIAGFRNARRSPCEAGRLIVFGPEILSDPMSRSKRLGEPIVQGRTSDCWKGSTKRRPTASTPEAWRYPLRHIGATHSVRSAMQGHPKQWTFREHRCHHTQDAGAAAELKR